MRSHASGSIGPGERALRSVAPIAVIAFVMVAAVSFILFRDLQGDSPPPRSDGSGPPPSATPAAAILSPTPSATAAATVAATATATSTRSATATSTPAPQPTVPSTTSTPASISTPLPTARVATPTPRPPAPTPTPTAVPTQAPGYIVVNSVPSRPVPAPQSNVRAGIELLNATVTSAGCTGTPCDRIVINITISYNLTDDDLLGQIELGYGPILVYGACLTAGGTVIVPQAGPHAVSVGAEIHFVGQFGPDCQGRTSIEDEIYAISVTVHEKVNAALDTRREFPFYAQFGMTR